MDVKHYKNAPVPSYQKQSVKTYQNTHINQVRGYILDSPFSGCKCGALIYPTVDDERLERGTLLPITDAHIVVKTINLNQGWKEIEHNLLIFVKKVV